MSRALAEGLLRSRGRLLVAGPTDAGKSTLVRHLAGILERPCAVITADPGQPLFGPPGAASRGWRTAEGWRRVQTEAVASLDALRFRMPLVEAVRRLVEGGGPLLVDAPGVDRGVGAAELLLGLVRAADLRAALWLAPEDDPGEPLPDLRAAGVDVIRVTASPDRGHRTPSQRRDARTAAWDAWLAEAWKLGLSLEGKEIAGTPPPPERWEGRQIALLDRTGATLAFGEVLERDGDLVAVRTPQRGEPAFRGVLLRDAWRDDDGHLTTAPRHRPQPNQPGLDLTAPLELPRAGRGATRFQTTLHGGLLGDPLVRLRHEHGHALLLDLGMHNDLSARFAHALTHVAITHAHMDHFGGFSWLLRARIGTEEPLVLVGPPDLAERVQSGVDAITWDRIGDQGPAFEIVEVHGATAHRFAVQAGRDGPEPTGSGPIDEGEVAAGDGWRLRATTLDHGGLPVLAFAVHEAPKIAVRPAALKAMAVRAGPWVGELKRRAAAGDLRGALELPDGSERPVAELASDLLRERPGRLLAYATDLADTEANRAALAELARGADLLICEASFLDAEADQAAATGHLTARACGAIAARADVELLVPFHFSQRYADRVGEVLEQVRSAFDRVWSPLDA